MVLRRRWFEGSNRSWHLFREGDQSLSRGLRDQSAKVVPAHLVFVVVVRVEAFWSLNGEIENAQVFEEFACLPTTSLALDD